MDLCQGGSDNLIAIYVFVFRCSALAALAVCLGHDCCRFLVHILTVYVNCLLLVLTASSYVDC